MSRSAVLLALLAPTVAFAADTTVPTPLSVTINSGATYTNTSTVSLTLAATDDVGVTQMCVSTSSTSCTTWVSYATSYSYNLGSTQGTRTLHVKFRDAAGNTSAAMADSVVLDSSGPTGGSASAAFAGTGSLGLSWSGFTDTYSGVSSHQIAYRTGSAPAAQCTSGTVVSASGASTTLTGLSDGTTYYVRVCPVDGAGNVGSGVTTSGVARAEESAPTGTVLINSGAAYATTTAVTLTLSATDDTGVTSMCISNTSTCTSWQSYTTTKTWTMSGNGSKTVYVYFRDASANVSSVTTDTIVVDTVRPSNSLITVTPSDQSLSLSWSPATDATSGVAGYKVLRSTSAVSSCSSGTLLYTGPNTSYTDTGLTNGTRYYYRVCAVDNAGWTGTGSTTSAVPASEFDPPTNGQVTINGGAAWTNTASVTLTLAATDASGVAKMCIANTSVCTSYQTFASSKTWALSGSSTTRTVNAWFEDSNGNQTPAAVSDTINIDTVKPVNGTVNASAGVLGVGLGWSGFSDALSGVASYKVVYAQSATAPASCNVGTTGYVGTGASVVISGLSQGSTYGFRVCAVDNAGNVSTGVPLSVTTLSDTTPPTGTITLNGGAAWTANSTVTVTPTATDDLSGISRWCVSPTNNSATCSWMTWTGGSTTSAVGSGTLYAWFEDGVGNVSAVTSDSIGLDTTAPTDGVAYAALFGSEANVLWTGATDAESGVVSYTVAYLLDGSEPTDCQSADVVITGFDYYSNSTTVTGLAAPTYIVRVCATDNAGNTSPGVTALACTLLDWYADGDGDGFGGAGPPVVACTQPAGYAATSSDCQDDDATISPGVTELCDDLDNDCDGLLDDHDPDVADPYVWYIDRDQDGYGDESSSIVACDDPTGMLENTPDTILNGELSGSVFGQEIAIAGDVNGDQIDDLLVGAYPYYYQMGRAYLFQGDSAGVSTSPSTTWEGTSTGDRFGHTLSRVGDVNGDGFGDVVVGAIGYDNYRGQLSLYHGSASGLSSVAATTLTGEGTNNYFGVASKNIGDINNDGYDDVIVGAHTYNAGAGRAYVYHGQASGLATIPATVLNGEAPSSYFGQFLNTAGDVNGDGYNDVIVGAYAYLSGTGRAYIYHGGASGLASTPATTMTGEATWSGLGAMLANIGDVNGDGYDDLMLGAHAYNVYTGRVYLHYGSATGVSSTPAETWDGSAPYEEFGFAIQSVGDVNSDGFSDVVISAPYADVNSGRAYLHLGGTAGLAATPSETLMGAPSVIAFGYNIGKVGDTNGDGYDDVLISGLVNNVPSGISYLYSGNATGLSSVATTFAGDGDDLFGFRIVGEETDLNDDGYQDIVIGAPTFSADTGRVYIYHGGPVYSYIREDLNIADCDDTDPTIQTDRLWYADTDGDGVGDSTSTMLLCAQPEGYVADMGDCNDAQGTIYPGAPEVCDDMDNDCDDLIDSLDPNVVGAASWYTDHDGDTYGDAASAVQSCTRPFGLVSNGDDCDDDDVEVGAPAIWYRDADMDGYGGEGDSILSCVDPSTAGELDGLADATFDGERTANYYSHAMGAAGDVNGDGYEDVVVGAYGYSSYRGRAYVYHGSEEGLLSTTVLLGEAANTGFGYTLGQPADVNGDGYDDVVVGAYLHNSGTGRAYVYHGGAFGVASVAATTLSGEAPTNYFSQTLCTIGDTNGDGYDDVAVAASAYSSNRGRVYLYHGSAAGLDSTAAHTLTGEASLNHFGYTLAPVGDINHDGYDDLMVGAYGYSSSAGRAYLYHGSAAGLLTTAAVTLTGTSGSSFGLRIANVGDVNGDSYDDVLIGAHTSSSSAAGQAKLYHGSATGLSPTAATTLSGTVASGYFGYTLSGGIDVNADGYGDVMVGAYNASYASLFLGSAAGLSSTATTLTGSTTGEAFGRTMVSLGDVNTDGYDDLLIGADNYGTATGQVYLYHGDASGLIPAIAITGDATNSAFGAQLVAADVNGDGSSDALVGAYGYSTATGRMTVFNSDPGYFYIHEALNVYDPDDRDPLVP